MKKLFFLLISAVFLVSCSSEPESKEIKRSDELTLLYKSPHEVSLIGIFMHDKTRHLVNTVAMLVGNQYDADSIVPVKVKDKEWNIEISKDKRVIEVINVQPTSRMVIKFKTGHTDLLKIFDMIDVPKEVNFDKNVLFIKKK